MNAFYISCEEKIDNSLRQKNAAVAGDPGSRTGIILTANYNARKTGIRTAMTVSEAKKLCGDLVLIRPDHKLYEDVSERIMDILSGFSPYIEQNSIDEAWLDMTNSDSYYKKPFEDIALDIQRTIYEKEEIPCSIGISFNRFLSKMAAEAKKPNGIVTINESNFKKILWPLKTEKMYGCGKVMAEKLASLGIFTIGDIANSDPAMLGRKLGMAGQSLYYNANAYDHDYDALSTSCETKSVSRENTLVRDMTEPEDIIQAMIPLAEDVAGKIRKYGCYFSNIYIIIKYDDFTKITRSIKIPPSKDRDILIDNVRKLVLENRPSKPVRLVGVGVSDLDDSGYRQIDLFDSSRTDTDEVYKVIDEKNQKYGTEIIRRGFYGNKRKR